MIVRIGINVSRLSGQRLGVGRYLEYMLKHWSRMLAPEEEVYAYLREAVPAESIAHLNLSPSIKLEQVGPKLPGFLWENLSLPLRARRMDVFFGPSYSLPLLARLCREISPAPAPEQIRFVPGDFSAGLPHFETGSFDGIVAGLAVCYAESKDPVTGNYTDPPPHRDARRHPDRHQVPLGGMVKMDDNRNTIVINAFSSATSERLYKLNWPDEPALNFWVRMSRTCYL